MFLSEIFYNDCCLFEVFSQNDILVFRKCNRYIDIRCMNEKSNDDFKCISDSSGFTVLSIFMKIYLS